MNEKRLIVLLLTLCLSLTCITACGGKGSEDIPEAESESTEAIEETAESEEEEAETETETEESESADADTGNAESAVLSPEFKKTMDDYEAFFDHYCEVMKKYKENPSDIEVISEMTDLITEETEMLERMENMNEDEMNTAELAYYIEVTARIEKKLLEAAG